MRNLDWKIDETRNYFIEEVDQDELTSKKHKMACTTLNNIADLVILASAVTVCVSISAFATLVSIPIGIMSSAAGIKICAKKYKSIIKREKKKNLIT